MDVVDECTDLELINVMNNYLQTGLKNPNCAVYPLQAKVIQAVKNGNNVLYIDGTGNGKSESYFILAKILRANDPNAGPIIVVEPLNALIDNQLERAINFGLSAAAYNSKMDDIQKGDTLLSISNNKIDILYLTPEMISSFTNRVNHPFCLRLPQFTASYKKLARHHWSTIPLIVIDEVHYISKVGHNFRPSYLEIWSQIRKFPWYRNAQKLGMTATFNFRVEQDIVNVLKFEKIVKGSFFRENIAIRVISVKNGHVKKVWLADLISIHETRNILVFCLSREECQKMVSYLETVNVVGVDYYFANRINGSQVLAQFLGGNIRILVATFDSIGAGFNKSDIHDVVWMYTPSSIVDFYQGLGRAGRGDAVPDAKCYLLTSKAWRKDGWLEIFVVIGNILKDIKTHESLVVDLVNRVVERFYPHSRNEDIELAIENGINNGCFVVKKRGDAEYLALVNANELNTKTLYLQNRKDEVSDMNKLNHNLCCSWQFVLDKLGTEVPNDWTCGICSFQNCCPEGDHQPDYSTASEVCYSSELNGVPVYALGRGNETVSLNSSVIRSICLRFLPDICDTPPEWAVTFIPDSSGKNEQNIASIAECLNNLSVVKFITINPDLQHLKMFQAETSQEEDYVLRKYVFDINKLLGVRKLLIYDDCINTGKTLMNAIHQIKQTSISEVCILVDTIYDRKNPPRVISQIDLSNV